MFDSGSIIWAAHRFYVCLSFFLFLVIVTCGRLESLYNCDKQGNLIPLKPVLTGPSLIFQFIKTPGTTHCSPVNELSDIFQPSTSAAVRFSPWTLYGISRFTRAVRCPVSSRPWRWANELKFVRSSFSTFNFFLGRRMFNPLQSVESGTALSSLAMSVPTILMVSRCQVSRFQLPRFQRSLSRRFSLASYGINSLDRNSSKNFDS